MTIKDCPVGVLDQPVVGVVTVVPGPPCSHVTAATSLFVPVHLGVDGFAGSDLQQGNESDCENNNTDLSASCSNWLEGFEIKTSKQDKNNYLQDSLETTLMY